MNITFRIEKELWNSTKAEQWLDLARKVTKKENIYKIVVNGNYVKCVARNGRVIASLILVENNCGGKCYV